MTDSNFDQRYQQMLVNAGTWLIKNRNTLKLCQVVLAEKYYTTTDDDVASPELAGFLEEIGDAVDVLTQVVGELRGTTFLPDA